jgi:hypothetical protein
MCANVLLDIVFSQFTDRVDRLGLNEPPWKDEDAFGVSHDHSCSELCIKQLVPHQRSALKPIMKQDMFMENLFPINGILDKTGVFKKTFHTTICEVLEKTDVFHNFFMSGSKKQLISLSSVASFIYRGPQEENWEELMGDFTHTEAAHLVVWDEFDVDAEDYEWFLKNIAGCSDKKIIYVKKFSVEDEEKWLSFFSVLAGEHFETFKFVTTFNSSLSNPEVFAIFSVNKPYTQKLQNDYSHDGSKLCVYNSFVEFYYKYLKHVQHNTLRIHWCIENGKTLVKLPDYLSRRKSFEEGCLSLCRQIDREYLLENYIQLSQTLPTYYPDYDPTAPTSPTYHPDYDPTAPTSPTYYPVTPTDYPDYDPTAPTSPTYYPVTPTDYPDYDPTAPTSPTRDPTDPTLIYVDPTISNSSRINALGWLNQNIHI